MILHLSHLTFQDYFSFSLQNNRSNYWKHAQACLDLTSACTNLIAAKLSDVQDQFGIKSLHQSSKFFLSSLRNLLSLQLLRDAHPDQGQILRQNLPRCIAVSLCLNHLQVEYVSTILFTHFLEFFLLMARKCEQCQ